MTNIFISYSRKDKAFAGRLTEALQKSELETWIDWEDIPPTADWMDQIHKGIEKADGFLFLLSPDSVASKVCRQEVDHAVKNGKRLIPIVARDVNPNDVHPALAKVNWIYCREDDDFDGAVDKILSAIRMDLSWVEAHKRLQVRALEWGKRKERSLLLHGNDLREAEEMLSTAGQKDPQPTDLQRRYVLESRRRESRTRNIILTISAIVVVCLACATAISIGSSIHATNQANIASTARAVAEDERLIALSNGLSSEALRLHDQGELSRAFLLSVQANQFAETARSKYALFTLLEQNRYLVAALNIPYEWSTGYPPDIRTNTKGDKAVVMVEGGGEDLYMLWDLSTFNQLDIQIFPKGSIVSLDRNSNLLILGDTGEPLNGVLMDVELMDNPLPIGAFGPIQDMIFSRGVVFDEETVEVGKLVLSTCCKSFKSSTGYCDDAAIYAYMKDEPFLQPEYFQVPDSASGNTIELDYDRNSRLFALIKTESGEMQLWEYLNANPSLIDTFYLDGYVPQEGSRGFEFSADSNLIIWLTDENKIIVWDISSRSIRYEYQPDMHVNNLHISPEGTKLALESEDGIHFLSLTESGIQPSGIIFPPGETHAMGFSGSGQVFAIGSFTHIWVWNAISGEEITQIDLTSVVSSEIRNISVSEDGNTIAVGLYTVLPLENPYYIYLVDVQTGVEMGPINGGFTPILSPDNKWLASVKPFDNQSINIWDVDLKNWEARACQVANRNLTHVEWSQYIGNLPYQLTCPNFPNPNQTPPP